MPFWKDTNVCKNSIKKGCRELFKHHIVNKQNSLNCQKSKFHISICEFSFLLESNSLEGFSYPEGYLQRNPQAIREGANIAYWKAYILRVSSISLEFTTIKKRYSINGDRDDYIHNQIDESRPCSTWSFWLLELHSLVGQIEVSANYFENFLHPGPWLATTTRAYW